jgi:hypothetical protein
VSGLVSKLPVQRTRFWFCFLNPSCVYRLDRPRLKNSIGVSDIKGFYLKFYDVKKIVLFDLLFQEKIVLFELSLLENL